MPIMNNLPQGNVTAPRGAQIRKAATYNPDTGEITEILLQDYDLVIIEEEDTDTIPASQIVYYPAAGGEITGPTVQLAVQQLENYINNKSNITITRW